MYQNMVFYYKKKGKTLENKIKDKYEKFNFLNNKNIFYPYYIYKVIIILIVKNISISTKERY